MPDSGEHFAAVVRRDAHSLPVTATYMSLPAWSIPVLKSTLFQQTAPFIVPLLILFLFFLTVHLRRIFPTNHNFTMGIESWGFSLPWLWSSSQSGASSSASHRKSNRKNNQSKSQAAKTRAEQIALNAVKQNDTPGMTSVRALTSNIVLKGK